MKFNVVVATHHKTGTVWMSAVFSAIAKELGASYIDFWSHYGRLDRSWHLISAAATGDNDLAPAFAVPGLSIRQGKPARRNTLAAWEGGGMTVFTSPCCRKIGRASCRERVSLTV